MPPLEQIPFNRPHYVGGERERILEAIAAGHISGGGRFTDLCEAKLAEQLGVPRVLLTPSCTAALELAAILLELVPGDEVIMPSFTSPSTANAFALRGAVPVFVDIREDTLNLDETQVQAAITKRTRAVVPVHYAGVGCEMQVLLELADRHHLAIIEDAAHGLMASYRGQALGAIGQLGALSFHETKNVTCGEGGALVIAEPNLVEPAEAIREKGTNRTAFLRGAVDSYTWTGLGSSFTLSDLNAAFLWAQLGDAKAITSARLEVWQRYHAGVASLESQGLIRRPIVPDHVCHNGHLYYLLLPTRRLRDEFIAALGRRGIHSAFHYVPLDSSPAGARLARRGGDLAWTRRHSGRIVRLPLWAEMPDAIVERVLVGVEEALLELNDPSPDRSLAPEGAVCDPHAPPSQML